MPTRCNRYFLLQILLLAQHVSGHHYAHHQELESIIQVVAALGIWCFGFQVVGMVWSWGLCSLYNTLELLMMGIVVPETCWASNKICNKYQLLHPVGILATWTLILAPNARGAGNACFTTRERGHKPESCRILVLLRCYATKTYIYRPSGQAISIIF